MRIRPFWALSGLLVMVGCHAPALPPIGGGGGPLPTAPPATSAPVLPVVVSPTIPPGGFPVQLPPLSPAPANTSAPGGGVTPASPSATPFGQVSNPPLQRIP